MGGFLEKEDYEEQRCLLNMNRGGERIDTLRVLNALDAHLNRNDYAAAEQHLKFWITEAEHAGDLHGMLTIRNEQIGLYRKTGQKEACFQMIEEAEKLLSTLKLEGTITYGTTMVNAATGLKAFHQADRAMPLYRKAQEVYEKTLAPDDERTGALYNNMALALMEQGLYAEAKESVEKALAIMKKKEDGELEEAITYLNLADLVSAETGEEKGEEKIHAYLEKAEDLLNTPSLPRNGYYAFVCEKCAPVFGYYGFFLTETELKERAKQIYERN